MLRAVRRHPVLFSLASVVLILGILAAGIWWQLLSDSRRLGLQVARLITRQTGVHITVERVETEGPFRWRLYDLHIPPGPHWSGDVRVRELRIEGGVLPFVAPRGRSITVVALTTSVTLGAGGEPFKGPTAEALEGLRQLFLRAADWPARFAVRVEGGELQAGEQVFSFAVQGEKSESGDVGLTLTVSPPGAPPALTVKFASRRMGDRVAMRIGLEGAPARLGSFWPSALPQFARLIGQIDGDLRAGGDLALVGRLEGRGAGHPAPAVLELTSRYRGAAARLEVSRLTFGWGPDVSLSGTATAELASNVSRATVNLTGTVERSRINAQLDYAGGSGDLTGKVDVDGIEAQRLFARAGLAALPLDLNVQGIHSTVKATVGERRVRLALDARLGDLEARRPLPGVLFDGVLQLDATLQRGDTGLSLDSLGPTTLTFRRGNETVMVLAASSREGAAWPLELTATIHDLRRVPALPALPSTLTGQAVISGSLDHARFTGALRADLPRAEVRVGRPVVATRMHIDVPVAFGTGPATRAGAVTIDRIEAFGFVLDEVASGGQFVDGLLKLPDISYAHYGGRGTGWIEASIDRRPVPLRSRIEGEHIDLAVLTREFPITVARLSGKVRYLIVLQHSLARGINGAGTVNSEEGGGEISVDAIQRLLGSAPRSADPTGLILRALESLRVFRYSALEADVRVSGNDGSINLTIEGKKRLGIIPPPVKAINFANVPISLLARMFSPEEAP